MTQDAAADRNVRLTVEYDGTRYHGFQAQAGGLPTIQGEIERALEQVTGLATRVAGAGRTDRGVHATGQVVSFHTRSPLPADDIQGALNAVLPRDIAVLSADEAEPRFHARFSARSREYRYTILNRRARSPLERNVAYHRSRPLDAIAMDGAAQELIGVHDFAAFSGIVAADASTIRCVQWIACRQEGERVYVDVVADAFLPHMVRNIVGTLLLVGWGKLDGAKFKEILAGRDRRMAGATAPAHGLCLTKVNY